MARGFALVLATGFCSKVPERPWLSGTLPREAPWTINYQSEDTLEVDPCWRQNDSLTDCCKTEGFSTCNGRKVRSRCCAFPGSVIHGEIPPRDVEQCWVTSSPLNVAQDDDGPFWVRQRNYLVSWILANSPSDLLETRLQEEGEISEELAAVLSSECPVGAVALQLLQSTTCSETRTLAAHRILRMNWAIPMMSGWPIFLLLAQAGQKSRKCPGIDSRRASNSARAALRAVEALCDEVEAATATAARRAAEAATYREEKVVRPGEELASTLAAAKLSLELLQTVLMSDEAFPPHDQHLWETLHRLQEPLSLRGTCPPGSFAAKARTLGWQYNICVRQPEALGSWLGASVVDKRIMNHGQWPECSVASQLLPSPLSGLSPQHWGHAGSGCIVLDLGANIGACTLLFAAMGHRVIAVEPEPSNLLMLHASLGLPQLVDSNSSQLGFGGVAVVPVAIDEVVGAVQLLRERMDAGNSTMGKQLGEAAIQSEVVHDSVDGADFSSTVATRPLDEVVEDQARRLGGGLSDVCMLKMDIEGAELRALRSAPRLLAGALRAIYFEFAPGPSELEIENSVELLGLLADHGFMIFGNREMTSGLSTSEERAYEPSEFEELTRRMASIGKTGSTLVGLKL